MLTKSVLISIKPKYCELIASGKKTVEIRKTKPRLEMPFKVYIYCTKDEPLYHSGEKFWCGDELGNGKVIGEFVCSAVDRMAHCGTRNDDIRLRIEDELFYKELKQEYLTNCQLAYSDIEGYSKGVDVYGWHISDLVIYDKPKVLGEFRSYNVKVCLENGYPLPTHKITRAPQSWCYVETANKKG